MTIRLVLALTCGFAIFATLLPPSARAQTSETHYRVYRPDGKAATLAEIADAMAGVDVVFVGEQHDDPTAHALEADILRLAWDRHGQSADRREVALSLEMIERDVQSVLDEYLTGLINEDHFLKSSRPWSNYKTDYRPLVEFAREHKLPVVAANAPGRYVNRVGRLGRASLDAMPKSAKANLPPMPYGDASSAYAAKFGETMKGMQHGAPPASPSAKPDPSIPPLETRMLDAQALRDATMADSIARFLKGSRHGLVVHVNGAFHSEGRMGVPEHLQRYRSKARMLVVTIASESDVTRFDAGKLGSLGDFVIVTDASLPRSMK
jgi:uncharacterized iron-regulated protein